jgi:hypothetical protein
VVIAEARDLPWVIAGSLFNNGSEPLPLPRPAIAIAKVEVEVEVEAEAGEVKGAEAGRGSVYSSQLKSMKADGMLFW